MVDAARRIQHLRPLCAHTESSQMLHLGEETVMQLKV